MSKFYVIGVYGYRKCSLLNTEANTLDHCKRAIAWQNSPRPSETPFHICKATDARGVFASVETGALFEVNPGGLTAEAFERVLNDIWPAA